MLDPSTIYKDSNGNRWTPGKCQCNFNAAHAILDVVIEGLHDLDKLLCLIYTKALEIILEVAFDAIPIGEIFTAAKTLVEGAKSFAENGLSVADFFGGWIKPVCQLPSNWNTDTFAILFGGLVSAPDSAGTSIGCKQPTKAKCVKPPKDKPDKPETKGKGGSPSTDGSPSKPTTNNPDPSHSSNAFPDKPTTNVAPSGDASKARSTNEQTTSTTSGAACKVKRADGTAAPPRAFLEPERNRDCSGGPTIRETRTSSAVGIYFTNIFTECLKEATQACYHYR